jgi:tight adherence protein C
MPNPAILSLCLFLLGVTTLLLWDGARRAARRGKLHRLMGVPTKAIAFAAQMRRIARFIPGAADDTLHQALQRAGYAQPQAPALFAVLRLLGAGGAFGAVLALRGTQGPAILLALLAGFAWCRILSAFLAFKAKGRARALSRELPPVIDVLLMILQSGVSIDQALRHAAAMLDSIAPLTGPLLKRTLADIDSGMPYEQAFERLGRRLGIAEGHDLTALIKQALLQGGEIMTPLERLSTEVAEKRLTAAREQVARKSIYLTAVMLGFFMPVLLIALAGPAVSTILSTLTVVKQQVHAREAR